MDPIWLERLGFSFIPKLIQGRAAELDLIPEYLAMAVQVVLLAGVSQLFDSFIPLLIATGILGVFNFLWVFTENKKN